MIDDAARKRMGRTVFDMDLAEAEKRALAHTIVVDESAYHALKGDELHRQRQALATERRYTAVKPKGNRAARRKAEAKARPKAPRW